LDFRLALEQLAQKAGVDLTQYESKNNRQLAQRIINRGVPSALMDRFPRN